MAGLVGFQDGSSWCWLVGQWHRCLDWALPKEATIGRPVFAPDGGHGGTAEGQGQGPASSCSQCPFCSVTLLKEAGHRQWRWPPVWWIVPNRQGLQRLAGLHSTNVQGGDLDRLARQLLVS